jgi:hypothetical protein
MYDLDKEAKQLVDDSYYSTTKEDLLLLFLKCLTKAYDAGYVKRRVK